MALESELDGPEMEHFKAEAQKLIEEQLALGKKSLYSTGASAVEFTSHNQESILQALGKKGSDLQQRMRDLKEPSTEPSVAKILRDHPEAISNTDSVLQAEITRRQLGMN